jgi:hypothetical protein
MFIRNNQENLDMKYLFQFLIIIPAIFSFFSCSAFPYLYNERDKVLKTGIDYEHTLDIADIKLEEGGFDSILTLWALRDQVITSQSAERISSIYLKYIDSIKSEFGIWHIAWAISNFYRLGDAEVKEKLKIAYEDALKRPDKLKQLKDIAKEFVSGNKIYYGDAHSLGRMYAKTHIIIKGNRDYLQSFDEFIDKNKNDKKLMEIVKKRGIIF